MARKEGSSAAIATKTASNTAKPAARLKVARLIGGVPEFFKRPSANNTETANVALTQAARYAGRMIGMRFIIETFSATD
jgi:hypothetical protein